MRRRHRRAALRLLLILLGGLCAGGCRTSSADWMGSTDFADEQPVPIDRPPRWRRDGPRMPAFSGADPRARGWVKVDGLLWIQARDREAYDQGLVPGTNGYVPKERALPASVPARGGIRMRTDHVALHTNVSWNSALTIAREAEAHVQRLMGGYGDLLGLRLPDGPLRVVVTAGRGEFAATLRGIVANPVSWGAFYDARSGIVYTSVEPAPSGALPWRADLRHEMTHQVLDLSRSPNLRSQSFAEPWFWLWEGFAIWTETLGDPPGTDSGAQRITRFNKRYAWNDWTPLAALFRLTQSGFEGRHYDQTASLMRYLLDTRHPSRRGATLDVVRRLLRGRLAGTALTRALGVDVAGLQADWQRTVGR